MSVTVTRIQNNKATAVDAVNPKDLTKEVALGIDCSSTCTGLSIISTDKQLKYSMAFKRDSGDDYIIYKVKLKAYLLNLFRSTPTLKTVFYEEPFLGYAQSSKVLIVLHTLVQEIKYENSPIFDYINFVEVPNQRWKKLFLAPAKIPAGTEAQKLAVRTKLESIYPFYKDLTQDECDATSMCLVGVERLATGLDELESKQKVAKFKYVANFIAANSDEEAMFKFRQNEKSYKIPKAIKKDSYEITELSGRGDFDEKVCEAIGNTDTVLIGKYKSDKYGNITLQYNLGSLVLGSKYLYVIAWRKTRKK